MIFPWAARGVVRGGGGAHGRGPRWPLGAVVKTAAAHRRYRHVNAVVLLEAGTGLRKRNLGAKVGQRGLQRT